MPCGTGKTVAAALYIDAIMIESGDAEIAIMVPSRHLMHQVAAVLRAQCYFDDEQLGLVGDGHDDTEHQIVVCVYNSVAKIAHRSFHTVIIDEGHHIHAGVDDTAVWSRHIMRLDTLRVLLMSASLSGHPDTVYELSRLDAVAAGRIVDTTLLIPVLEHDGDPKAALVHLLDERRELVRVLAYCNSRAAGQQFCAMLVAAGIPAAYFDGRDSAARRNEFIAQLADGRVRVLVTVRVLSEGVDIQCATTCMFVEPRNGHTEALQCIGRVERLHPDKTLAYVVLPSTNEERELARFLRTLARADPRIAAAVASKTSGRINIVTTSDAVLIDYTVVYASVAQLLAGADGAWETKCAMVRTYVSEHGQFPAQSYRTAAGGALGYWLSNQRQRRSKLSVGRVALLEAIPGWWWKTKTARAPLDTDREIAWGLMCGRVEVYVLAHGKLPARTYVDTDGAAVGSWVARQRRLAVKLSSERVARLEKIPGWAWRVHARPAPLAKDKNVAWRLVCASLEAFVAENGKFPPCAYRDPGGINLNRWVLYQRDARPCLTRDQIARLESIAGWSWVARTKRVRLSADKNQAWSLMCARVEAFVAETGTFPGQRRCADDGTKVGQWAHRQRRTKAKLTAERIARLESIPGWWW